jgi:hypothetical protein
MMMRNRLFLSFIFKEWMIFVIMAITTSGILGGLGIYLSLLLIPVLLIKQSIFIYFDRTAILLIIFSIVYAIFSSINGYNLQSKSNLIFYMIYPTVYYIIGRYLMDHWTSQSYFLFLLLIVPIALPAFFSISQDIIKNGFGNQSRDVEILGRKASATLIGLQVSLCLTGIGLFFSTTQYKIEKVYQYLLVILGILGIVSVSHLLNRTGLVIAVICILFVFSMNFRKTSYSKILLLCVLISLIFYELYPLLSSSKIFDYYAARNVNASNAGGRIERWEYGINLVLTQPFGINKSEVIYHAHNFWLDVAKVAGIFPFIALVSVTLIHLRKSYFIIRSHISPLFLSSWLLALNVGFFLSCMVEPIMEGSFAYALIYFCFWGMTSELFNKLKRQEKQYLN